MSVEENTMMAKAAKYDKLMTELKAKVECPVCLTVPTGHLAPGPLSNGAYLEKRRS